MNTDDDAIPVSSTRYSVIEKPVIITDNEIRCKGAVKLANGVGKVCNRLLANFATRPWSIQCPRCKVVSSSPEPQPPPDDQPADDEAEDPSES